MDEHGQGLIVFALVLVILVVVIIVLGPAIEEAINGLFTMTETLAGALPQGGAPPSHSRRPPRLGYSTSGQPHRAGGNHIRARHGWPKTNRRF